MDNNVLIALIAAGSACVGALIPSFFSYIGKRLEYKNDRKAKINDIRRTAFDDYIDSLQKMINDSNEDNFHSLQKVTNKLLLFAGPKLSKLINQYYSELIERANQGNPFTKEEQTKYHTKIINTMRKELGVSKAVLKDVNMIRA